MEFTNETYREIETLRDALEILEENGLLTHEVKEQVTGFQFIPATGKHTLVGIPFLIVSATHRRNPDDDSAYVDLMVVTVDDRRIWFRDSSRGIYRQLEPLFLEQEASVIYGIWVRKGLTFKDFPYKGATSRTYYLDETVPKP